MSFFSSIRNFFTKRSKWEEKRKFIRLTAHHLLKYKVMDKAAEMSFVRNISAGGVLFYSKEELPVGNAVEMEINFPHYPHPIKVVAKVIRTKALGKMGGFEVGAEFINVEEDARDFINKKILAVREEVQKETGGEEKPKEEDK